MRSSPSTDLWPGIAASIEKRKVVRPRFAARRSGDGIRERALVNWRRGGSIAAAAMLLVAVSSGITAYLVRTPRPLDDSAGTMAPPQDFITAAWDGFQAAERSYQEITDELLQALDEHRSDLSPETIRIVEESLRSIEQAITVARAALERDPANGKLLNQLPICTASEWPSCRRSVASERGVTTMKLRMSFAQVTKNSALLLVSASLVIDSPCRAPPWRRDKSTTGVR